MQRVPLQPHVHTQAPPSLPGPGRRKRRLGMAAGARAAGGSPISTVEVSLDSLGATQPPPDLKTQQTPAWREPHSTGDPGVPPQSQGRFVTPPQSHSGVCLSPPSLSRALCLPLTPGCVCSHLSQLRAGIWGGWEGSSPLGEPRRRGQTPGNCAVPAPGCAGRNGTSP